MKIVYLFDQNTRHFLCEYIPQESPLEPGEYITPESSTDLAPPSFTDLQECKFDGEKWVVTDKPLPEPAEPHIPTFEDVRQALQLAIDIKAQALGFSGGNALMLYAGFTNPFQTLSKGFATWEASVWVEAGQYKAEVIAGSKPMLSPEEAVSMMPVYPD